MADKNIDKMEQDLIKVLDNEVFRKHKQVVLDSKRSSWAVNAKHIGKLKVGFLSSWLFGKKPMPPQLDAMKSKEGGIPYLEEQKAWPLDCKGSPCAFIGQINFAEIKSAEGKLPEKGILAIFWDVKTNDLSFHTRWYSKPEITLAKTVDSPVFYEDDEYQLTFEPTFTVDLQSILASEELFDRIDEVEVESVFDDLYFWEESNRPFLASYCIGAVVGQEDWWKKGEEPKKGEVWLQLWSQMMNSVYSSLMIEEKNLARGDFSNLRTLVWQ